MMELLQDKNRRLGLIGTIIFHILVLLFFIFYGLTTPVPIPQQTIAINFGTSSDGMGRIQPEEIQAAPKSENQVKEEVKPVEPVPVKSNTEAVTQDHTETINLDKKKTKKCKQ